MGLQDRYRKMTSAATSTPATPPAPSAAPASPASAPTAGAGRDLAALRARLASGANGGVNSPEGAEKITERLIEPRTQETADGGAEPIPAAGVTAESTAPVSTEAPKRKRRTKAEMEAARAVAPTTPISTPEDSATSTDAASGPSSELTRIADALELIAGILNMRLAGSEVP